MNIDEALRRVFLRRRAFAARRNANIQEMYRAVVRCNNAVKRTDAFIRKLAGLTDESIRKLAGICA